MTDTMTPDQRHLVMSHSHSKGAKPEMNTTETTTEKIIRLIKENPQITNKELAEALFPCSEWNI